MPAHSLDGDPGLLLLLSTIAGLVDVIGFLRLGQVFTAHITGNLVLLLAGAVGAGSPTRAQLLTIPVFAVAVALAYLIARRASPSRGRGELLVAEALLLLLVLTLALKPRGHPQTVVVVTAMAAVAAMAFQNAPEVGLCVTCQSHWEELSVLHCSKDHRRRRTSVGVRSVDGSPSARDLRRR